jgi:hypothetical protein
VRRIVHPRNGLRLKHFKAGPAAWYFEWWRKRKRK